jgi:Ca2+-binding EF-hand superfamily protein
MAYSDEQLRAAVDAVFSQFDKDGSNTLDRGETANLVNAALNQMGANRQATAEEVDALIQAVDANNDGKIAKPELYEIFKRVANQ